MSVNKRDLSGLRLAGVKGELNISQEMKVEEKKPAAGVRAFQAPEKVTDNWGACAGAGSDYFHAYREKRDFQLNREREFEREFEEEKDFDEHQAKRMKYMEEDEAKTSKRRYVFCFVLLFFWYAKRRDKVWIMYGFYWIEVSYECFEDEIKSICQEFAPSWAGNGRLRVDIIYHRSRTEHFLWQVTQSRIRVQNL